MEYRVICSSSPHVVSCGVFSAWCDLDELVRESLGHSTSLTNAILALGYPYGAFAPQKRKSLHRAGNDVVRELTVLFHMLHFSQTTATMMADLKGERDTKEAEETEETDRTADASIAQDTKQCPLPHPFQYPMRPPRIKAPIPERLQASEHRPSPHSNYPFTVSLRPKNRCTMRSVARDARALC